MNLFTIAIPCAFAACASITNASIVYSGLDFIYEYAGFGDINLEINQDRMTDNVWITRSTIRGIFNIAQEASYQGSGSTGPSPIGTMWAFGTTADFDTLTYTPWAALSNGSPPTLVGQNVVVYLQDDDTYIDLMFTSWGEGGSGGQFGYVRSNIPSPTTGALLAIAGLMSTRRRR